MTSKDLAQSPPVSEMAHFVSTFGEIDHPSEKAAIYSAALNCLTDVEVCDRLDLTFEEDIAKRNIKMARIRRGLEQGIKECHIQLAEKLAKAIKTISPKKMRACGGCLGTMLDYLPDEIRNPMLSNLINSSTIYLKEKAYKSLRKTWSTQFEQEVLASFVARPNELFAKLIVEKYPVNVLVTKFDLLQAKLKNSPPLSTLYRRIGEHNFDTLKKLPKDNEIRYAYVLVKLGKTMDTVEALELFERNKLSDDLGLLIWSFGQMKLGSVLKQIYSVIDDIPNEKYGIKKST